MQKLKIFVAYLFVGLGFGCVWYGALGGFKDPEFACGFISAAGLAAGAYVEHRLREQRFFDRQRRSIMAEIQRDAPAAIVLANVRWKPQKKGEWN